MALSDVSALPVNLDATHPDDLDNPGRKAHQTHHDSLHQFAKTVQPELDALARRTAEYAEGRVLVVGELVLSAGVLYRTSTGHTAGATIALANFAVVGGVTDATTTVKGVMKLAGDLAGTSDLPTVPGLAGKLNTSALGASVAVLGDASFPTLLARYIEITAAIAGEVVNRDGAIALASTADRARANHSGTQSLDTTLDSATRLAFLVAERSKLTGIAAGATVNSTDAALLARANHTGTQAVGTITGLALVATSGLKADVGLGSVDNTPDASKPVSTAQAAANNLRLLASANLSDLTLPATARTNIGLGSVDNTSDASKPVSTAQAAANNLRLLASANLSDVALPATARTNLGLGNVDNTSDASKPVSTAQAAANNLRLLASANLSDVAVPATARTNLGLGNVDNTSDANKPVSTAQNNAIVLRVALTGTQTLTGTQMFVSAAVGAVAMTVRLMAGQTADLQRWQDDVGTNVAVITNIGRLGISFTGITGVRGLEVGAADSAGTGFRTIRVNN